MNQMFKYGELILCWQKFLFGTGFNFYEVVHVASDSRSWLVYDSAYAKSHAGRNHSSIVMMFTPFWEGSHYFAIKCINADDVIAISL